jgi:uncharacterized protein (TIGR03437 family)
MESIAAGSLASVFGQNLVIQVPYEVSGQVTLQINTPNGSAATGFHASQLAPSIIAVASQNALCSPSNPAISGGQVTIYATGLGPAWLQR